MNRYALVIGISQYQNRSLPALQKPATSAEAIAKLLEAHGNFQEVRRLPANWLSADRAEVARAPLTEADLSREIKRLLNEQAIGSEVLIYFSGHGFVVSDNLGGSEAYLAASDTQIGVEAGRVIWQQNGIRLRSLTEQLTQANFSSLVMLLDCCHSGSLIESGVMQQALATTSSRNYSLIAACRGFEKAYEGEAETPYSNFTAALLGGLERKRAGENGQISSGRLFDHVSQTLKGLGQEPIQLGWGRSIAIVTYPPSAAVPPTPTQRFNPANPYVGLAAFEAEQADYFFGRDAEIRALLERLDPLQNPARRFLAVIGPSGSGKSSLVKAGLVPALAQDALPGSSQWQIEPLKPGQYPLQELRNAIDQFTDVQPPLLVIDQFEELFTLCQSEEEQREFLTLLNQQVTRADRPVRVVITMRGDFLDRCARYPESAELINQSQPTTFVVTPLTDDKLAAQLGQAIAEPAARHGVEFQPGLAARILAEVRNQLGAMPLLQYALTELWHHCIPDDTAEPLLTWAGYEAIGGVRGALHRRADSLYAGLTESNRDLLKKLVMELVQIGEDGIASRRRAHRQELWALATQESVDRILDRLTSERFLMVDGDTVEVAHEALLSEAPRIRAWIEENRENLRLRDRFERDCREWQEQGRSTADLLNPRKLAAVQEWIENTNPVLSTDESEFVEESVRERDREIQTQLEQERQLREAAEARELAEIEKKLEAEARAEAEAERAKESSSRVKAERQKTRIAAISGVTLAVLAVMTGLSALRAQVEKRNAQTSEIKALTATAEALDAAPNQLDALFATVKALKEIEQKQMDVPEVLQKIIRKTREHNRLDGHLSDVIDADFSSNGNLIGSTSVDRTVQIWRKDGQLVKTLRSFGAGVWGIDFSPNNQLIATGCVDGIIRIFDFDGNPKKKLEPKDWKNDKHDVLRVRFSPDSSMLVSAHQDGAARLWRVSDGKLIKTFPHSNRVYGVDFSPNTKLIVTGSWDKKIRVWRISDSKVLREFEHKNYIHEVAFSSDGDKIASASWDGTVKVWSIKTGSLLRKLRHKEGMVYGVGFSPDGKTLVSGGTDRIVRLWDVETGELLQSFEGHSGTINAVNFSPDGKFLISTSDDRTVRVWSLVAPQVSSLEIGNLIQSSCTWLQDYIGSNVKFTESDRQICVDFKTSGVRNE